MLTVLESSYVFADRGDGIADAEERTIGELRVAVGLFPFLVHRAWQRICDTVYCSESEGFALHANAVRENELEDVVAVRERCRLRSLVRRPGESHLYASQPAENFEVRGDLTDLVRLQGEGAPDTQEKALQAAETKQQLLLDTKLADNAVELAAVE